MKPLLSCIALFLTTCISAQSSRIDSIVNMAPLAVTKVEVEENDFTKVYVPSSFAEKEIKDTSQFQKLRNTRIVAVELVYTRYRQSETFVQIELNRDRLIELNKIFPEIFESDVHWRLIEQTQADDSEEAGEYFHGFIFTIQPKLKITVGKTEMDYLDSVMEKLEKTLKPTCATEIEKLLLEKKLPNAPIFGVSKFDMRNYLQDQIQFPDIKHKRKFSAIVNADIYVSEEGKIDSFSTYARKVKPEFKDEVDNALSEMPEFSPSTFRTGNIEYVYRLKIQFSSKSRRKEKVTVLALKPQMMPHCSDSSVVFSGLDYSSLYIPDTTVITVFKRNEEWKNMLVVCDFTGSMAPYTAQLLVWYHLMLSSNDDRVKYFCFFNDGNTKPDSQKKIGSTGGIYYGEASTIDDVRQLAKTTMINGDGGDVQENNVEALLGAMKQYPDAEDIIMIADNFATPRDLSLLSKINRPIKIILCGTQYGINVEYLNFARKTGSTVHTITEDIVNLSQMKEGERITIDGITYEIIDGEFRKVVGG